MAKKCVRKTDERAMQSPNNMERAVNTAKKGYMGITIHASSYSLRGSTLRRRLKVEPAADGKVTAKVNRKSPLLGSDKEAELEQLIMDLQARGFCLTRLDIQRLANEFMEARGSNHNFNKDTDLESLARAAWVTSFLEQHSNVLPGKDNGLISRSTGTVAVNGEVCNQHFSHQGLLVCCLCFK